MGIAWKKWLAALFVLLVTMSASAQVEEQVEEPEEQLDSPFLLDEATKEHKDGQIVNFAGAYIVDMLSNLSGGIRKHGETLGDLNLVFNVDLEQGIGLKGGAFHTYILANHGGSFSKHVGDYQTVSHIEAPATVSVLEAYYEQRLLDDRLSMIVGLYAVDSEFDTRTSSGLFVHSSPGTGADLGQVGINGPGIFPFGALGVRLLYEDKGWYGQAAVVEGIPGDPDHPFGTHLSLDPGEGVFVIGEAGHKWEDEVGELGKVAVGAWGFSRPYETLLDANQLATNRGAYVSLEKTFYRETEDPNQGLAAYLRVGVADGRINKIQNFVGTGVVYTGPFGDRPRDQVGVAVNAGLTSSDLVSSGGYDGNETALELTYSFSVNENLSLQPDLQYIINPGFDPALGNALVVGLRAVVTVNN